MDMHDMTEDQKVLFFYTLVKKYGSINAAAGAEGFGRNTVTKYYRKALDKGKDPIIHSRTPKSLKPKKKEKLDIKGIKNDEPEYLPAINGFAMPKLDSAMRSPAELIEHRKKEYARLKRAHKQRQWMRIKVEKPGPICLVGVGDPHIDDNGCNIELLDRDIDIMGSTDAMFKVGLGDYTNNWHGYLRSVISQHQSVTQDEGLLLARDMIERSKMDLIIKGNHDIWSKRHGGGDPLEWMALEGFQKDWKATFILVFPNGREIKVSAAHDFKGHSMWNPNHGLMKEEQLSGSEADIYLAGDKHNWIITQYENARAKKFPLMVRTRGYKHIDGYAEQLGFESQDWGSSVGIIIDPEDFSPDGRLVFTDLLNAKIYLEALRERQGFNN